MYVSELLDILKKYPQHTIVLVQTNMGSDNERTFKQNMITGHLSIATEPGVTAGPQWLLLTTEL